MGNNNIIAKLERKIGRFAIKNLIVYVLIAYVIGYVLIITESKLHLYQYVTMNPALVMQGQVWRLFTWICSIPQTLSMLVVFMFIFYYFIGRTLEQTMGAFRYNLYMLSGWFFMTLGSMVVYWITGASLEVSTYYLNLASFLAFALLYPNVQVYLFFVLPIKIKWLAYLDVAYLLYQVINFIVALSNSWKIDFSMYIGVTEHAYRMMLFAQIFSIFISLLNFVIFFFMVRKITPKNVKFKYDQAKAQRERRKKWNESWNNAYTSEKENTQDEVVEEAPYVNAPETQAPVNETRAERKKKEKLSKYGQQEYQHKCEVCGRTNVSDPDLVFRYCSRCDGNHEYCEDHIFNHEHVHE